MSGMVCSHTLGWTYLNNAGSYAENIEAEAPHFVSKSGHQFALDICPSVFYRPL